MGYDLLVSCMSPPTGDCADNILNYADKGLWNPNTREIHYIGQGHGGRELKFITYNDASGKWTREAKPEWDCSPAQGCYSLVHGYEATTLDPATGNIYARKFNSTAVYKWTRSSKTWTQLPAAPNPAVAVALQYFPEMGESSSWAEARCISTVNRKRSGRHSPPVLRWVRTTTSRRTTPCTRQ